MYGCQADWSLEEFLHATTKSAICEVISMLQCERQLMLQKWQHLRSSQSFNHITLNLHIQGYYKVCQEIELLTNFCSPKKRTLQTFVVKKRTPYKPLQSQQADTLNFCNEKAETTNVCSKKAHTLQTFVVSKSGHHKLLQ